MIGSGLKKLARENGMTLSGGAAYGALRGYTATLSEGAGYKKIDFATVIPAEGQHFLRERLGQTNIRALYRVQNISYGQRVIQITFRDTPGTTKKLRAFLDFFLPLLEECGASRADICAQCGNPITAPVWVQINGVCYPMHEDCACQVEQILGEGNSTGEKSPGSYRRGAAGALIAALLGAALWAMILNAGYIAAAAGLAIGVMVDRGYRMAGGKEGRMKIRILILALVLSVVLGTFGSDAIEIAKMMAAGSLPGFHYGEIPLFILALLLGDPGYQSALLANLLKGIFYAGLGVFLLLRQSAENTAPRRFRYMK